MGVPLYTAVYILGVHIIFYDLFLIVSMPKYFGTELSTDFVEEDFSLLHSGHVS